MRAVDESLDPTDRYAKSIETCVQCLGCETACPSDVPFARLIEGARRSLGDQHHPVTPRWLRLALRSLRWHRLVLVSSTVAVALARVGVPVHRLGIPAQPLRRPRIASTGADVYLHTGCVMDAWYRPAHAATVEVLRRMGIGVMFGGAGGACCGALSDHAGDHKAATARAVATVAAFGGSAPILVNSAGCGAALKSYGSRLGTEDARRFSDRVLDLFEFLEANADRLPKPRGPAGWDGGVTVQDPCHLSHAQGVHESVHRVLGRYGRLVPVAEADLCCGAGGSYSLIQPELSNAMRDRKAASIRATGAARVASANPGCASHLAGAGIDTIHPIQLLLEALEEADVR